MKRATILAALIALPLSAAAPLAAQDDPSDLAERLFEEFLRGTEDTLRELLEEAKPELEGLLRQIERLPMYEAPEILPNGDILIRRRPPLGDRPAPVEPREPLPPAGSLDNI